MSTVFQNIFERFLLFSALSIPPRQNPWKNGLKPLVLKQLGRAALPRRRAVGHLTLPVYG